MNPRVNPGHKVPEGHNYCPSCKLDQPLNKFQRDRKRWNGLRYQCNDCRNLAERTRTAQRAGRPVNPPAAERNVSHFQTSSDTLRMLASLAVRPADHDDA